MPSFSKVMAVCIVTLGLLSGCDTADLTSSDIDALADLCLGESGIENPGFNSENEGSSVGPMIYDVVSGEIVTDKDLGAVNEAVIGTADKFTTLIGGYLEGSSDLIQESIEKSNDWISGAIEKSTDLISGALNGSDEDGTDSTNTDLSDILEQAQKNIEELRKNEAFNELLGEVDTDVIIDSVAKQLTDVDGNLIGDVLYEAIDALMD